MNLKNTFFLTVVISRLMSGILLAAGETRIYESVLITPDLVTQGDGFTATFKIREVNGEAITISNITLAILDNSGNHLFDMDNEIENWYIPANGTRTYTASGYTHSGYLSNPGTYKAVARILISSGWADYWTINSSIKNYQYFTVQAAPEPDLTVSNISGIPSVHKQGETFNTSVTVNRSGGELIASSWVMVKVYASSNSSITTSDTEIATTGSSDFLSSVLNSSGSQTKTINASTSSLTPGDYYIGAIVDPTDYHSESDENNNSLAGTVMKLGRITVTYPNSSGISWQKGSTQTVTWTSENIAGNVHLQYWKGGTAKENIAGSTNNDGSHTFTVSGDLAEGSDYQVGISDVNTGLVWDFSNNNFTIYDKTGILSPPSNFTALANGNSVNLKWTDNSSNEDGFKIDRRIGDTGSFTLYHTTGPNTTSYIDNSVPLNQIIYYRTIAFNSSTESDYSEYYAVTLAAPTNVNSTTISSSQIDLVWQDNAIRETGFKIEHRIGSIWSEIGFSQSDNVSFSDIGLNASTTYDYRVRAYLNSGQTTPHYSDYSNISTSTTEQAINASVTLLEPNGNELWVKNTNANIRWSQQNVTGNVQIHLYKGGIQQSYFNRIIENQAPNTGLFTYMVPSDISTGDDYYVGISATNGSVFDFSNDEFSIHATNTLDPPQNFRASTRTPNSIIISWDSPSGIVAGYYVYMSTQNNGGFIKIADIPNNSYPHLNLIPNHNYNYYVIAYNNETQSNPSVVLNTSTTEIDVVIPQNLTVLSVTSMSVALSWSGSSEDQGYYIYYRKNSAGNFTRVTGNSDKSFILTGLEPSTNYEIAVSAYVTGGESNKSASVIATTTSAVMEIKVYDGNPEVTNIAYPYKNPASIFNKLENLTNSHVRQGSCTDGVSRLIIVVTVDQPPDHMSFALRDELGSEELSSTGSIAKMGEQNEQSNLTFLNSEFVQKHNGQYSCFAVYKPPVDFERVNNISDRDRIIREVNIRINTSSNSYQRIIKLFRPPVILVHGLNSNPSVWASLMVALPTQRTGYKFSFDYSNTNTSSFCVNSLKLRSWIQSDVYRVLRGAGYACNKIDFVGHSMGGILVRLLEQDPTAFSSGFREGYIHKLITIGTPHLGSEFASLISNPFLLPDHLSEEARILFAEKSMLIYILSGAIGLTKGMGAIDDLCYGSPAIRNITTTNAPCHAILGNASGKKDIWLNALYSTLGKVFIVGGKLGINAWETSKLLLGDQNDYVVSKQSQIGGNSCTSQSILITHLEETEDTFIIQRVINLLSKSVNDNNSFGSFTMPLTQLNQPLLAKQNYKHNIMNSSLDNSDIEIIYPTNPFTISSGNTFTINVGITDTSIISAVAVVGFNTFILDTLLKLNYQVSVPYEFIGSRNIYAIALDKQGNYAIDSLYCQVFPASSLLSINLQPDSITFVQTDSLFYFNVNGFYSDNMTRNITSISNLSFSSSDTSIAFISSNGSFKIHNFGTVSIIATIGSFSDTSQITINETTTTAVNQDKNLIPSGFYLSQNYPNPFNPSTNIQFGLPKSDFVTLRIYNILGQEVVSIYDNCQINAGHHTVNWNGLNDNGFRVSTGIYIYRLETNTKIISKKMILIR